jgi:uncharacterized protein YjbJ (UPF0337 family)
MQDGGMSIWTRAKAKWDELLGRAEELYGESHGDAAAEVHGEAVRLEGEALDDEALDDKALDDKALDDESGPGEGTRPSTTG